MFDGTGVLVEYLPPPDSRDTSGTNQINRLVEQAERSPDRYPLLSGIDRYDDTSFNVLQASRLCDELRAIRSALDDPAADVADAIAALITDHMTPGPRHYVHHRHMQFIGD